MLPLSDHRTDYYLTIPVIGIAMLGGCAAAGYWRQPPISARLLAIPVAVYLFAMIPVTRAGRPLVAGQIAGGAYRCPRCLRRAPDPPRIKPSS